MVKFSLYWIKITKFWGEIKGKVCIALELSVASEYLHPPIRLPCGVKEWVVLDKSSILVYNSNVCNFRVSDNTSKVPGSIRREKEFFNVKYTPSFSNNYIHDYRLNCNIKEIKRHFS